jgi:hypothetical protein
VSSGGEISHLTVTRNFRKSPHQTAHRTSVLPELRDFHPRPGGVDFRTSEQSLGGHMTEALVTLTIILVALVAGLFLFALLVGAYLGLMSAAGL